MNMLISATEPVTVTGTIRMNVWVSFPELHEYKE